MAQATNVPTSTSGAAGPRGGPTLRPRALELPGVVMQALTHIAPAVGMIAFIPMVTGYSGVTAPLAYLVALVIVLMLGVSLTQLAKYLPAAGGYFTYISATLHPRLGFLTAWMFFIVELVAPGAGFGFGGVSSSRTRCSPSTGSTFRGGPSSSWPAQRSSSSPTWGSRSPCGWR